ncbi:MAG TPA: pre-peptidase C-terminal domain-containing protein [Gammaproteobacteria bacterium]|nr:pre-peptidase C-terminal domain-containing protein [Gammaproteobacteria bacterium]
MSNRYLQLKKAAKGRPWLRGFLRVAIVSTIFGLVAGPALAAASSSGAYAVVKHATHLRANDVALGPVAASQPVHVVISLKLRHQARLKAVIRSHQTLTSAKFISQFSPTLGQAQAAAEFLKHSGFTHITISPNRLLISGDGTAKLAETAFQTSLVRVRTHTGRHAFANSRPIKIPGFLRDSVVAVLGLQNVHTFHIVRSVTHTNGAGTNAIIGHNPTDFDDIYGGSGLPTAAGVPVGIVTEGDLSNVLNDLQQFTSNNGLPSVATQIVTTDGTSSDTSGDGEWDLDSQDIIGMAGGEVGKLIFYNIPNLTNSALTDDFNRIVNDNAVKVVNVSLGECELSAQSDGTAAAQDQIFEQAVAQGQTISVSSGDSGADECNDGGTKPSWPASSQYVVAVGGTTLDASSTSWNGETAWSGTGGSPSTFEPMPSWQQGVGQNTGHDTRGVPDIAFDANPNSGAIVIVDGRQQQIGGTSLASPLFVGAWARMLAAKGSGLGFAAPLLYQLPGSDFHDVTSGDNGGETAAAGWDYTTGFGSLILSRVANDLGSGGGGGGGGNALQDGVPISGLSGASGSDTYFTMDVPAGATNLTFTTSGGSGDVDLYVKFGSQPTLSSYDCRPYLNGNSESCTFASPQAGTWYVMLHGYQSYSNVTLEGSYETGGGGSACPSGYTQYTGSLSAGQDAYEPDGNYNYSGVSGTHSGILTGPAGTDFDLYLEKWNGSQWVYVASSTSSTPNERIDYNGTSGYYLWDIYAYAGRGNFSFCLSHP